MLSACVHTNGNAIYVIVVIGQHTIVESVESIGDGVVRNHVRCWTNL